MGRRGRVRRRSGGHVQDLAGLGAHFGRIHEAIAAHPDFVIGYRQIRDHIAALVVRHDHAGKFGGKIRGLGDDPDASLRPIGATHHAADVIRVDGHDGGRFGQSAASGKWRCRHKRGYSCAQKERGFQFHLVLP